MRKQPELSIRSRLFRLRPVLSIFLRWPSDLIVLHSFPTRRSSDLDAVAQVFLLWGATHVHERQHCNRLAGTANRLQDRKSTRLNSSHRTISYAVFCLKKKNQTTTNHTACQGPQTTQRHHRPS